MIETDFSQPLASPWRLTEIGDGKVIQSPDALRLTVPPTSASRYSDAQLTDYAGKSDFLWRPPVSLTITARTELTSTGNSLVGTAGFGFWNHPFVPGERGVRLPQAVWFFFSSAPSNMQLARGVPGPGWKAATIDATRWPFFALLPTAPLAVLLMRIPALYNRLWPIGQRAIGVSEYLLDTKLLTEMHTYTIDWQPKSVTFRVDGRAVHRSATSPRGPLGVIAWIDNQYAVVTPQGRFGFGLLPVRQEQTLVLQSVNVNHANILML
jgi:hypothetical protein